VDNNRTFHPGLARPSREAAMDMLQSCTIVAEKPLRVSEE